MSGATASDPRDVLLERALERAEPGLAAVILAAAEAGRVIARHVQRARIEDVVGDAGSANVHAEAQQKLDVLADELLIEKLSAVPALSVCGSEEEETARVVRSHAEGGRYAIAFDPLDGSSNIDVGVGVGTIFGIWPVGEGVADPAEALLQRGRDQVAAGYLLYGSQVALVVSLGHGVDMFVLDPDRDAFVRVLEGIRIPDAKKIYSINEAYTPLFPAGIRRYLAACHADGYGGRYIGSMVADVHRTLLKGGVFLYPETTKNPGGKLRLLYEAAPMAFLIDQAGGLATTGQGPVLDVAATGIHQRTPIVLGSKLEVERVLRHLD